MPGPVNRSKTRTETADDLRSIAADTRRAADVLDQLYQRVDELSKPVYDTGWTYPIGTIGGFGMGLRAWADELDRLATEEPPTSM
jgi:hypothetical protein